jgi:hypothetical protein
MTAAATTTSVSIGVVVERRATNHPWQQWSWLPVAVLAGAPAGASWRELREGPGWIQYHAATLPLELHRKETAGYRLNLSQEPPRVYVVMRRGDNDDFPYQPFLVTASPHEAEAYLASGEEIVEGVSMPDSLIALLQDFVDHHHVEEPFVKRSRRRSDADAAERMGMATPRPGRQTRA